MTRYLNPIFVMVAIGACADDLAPSQLPPDAPVTGEPDPDAPPPPPQGVTTTRESDGTYTTLVDATADAAWTHADFETGGALEVTGPWDLRFQRFHISTNGGITGSGGVEVARVDGQTFAQVTAAPSDGWFSDVADGDDPDTAPDYAFDQGTGWYDYDPMTHVLTPKPIVWVVKTAGGATLKLEIATYYDAAGTAGWFTLHWGIL